MKRIIRLALLALMLVSLLLSTTACEFSTEAMTGYTRLRDHVLEKADEKGDVALDGSSMGFSSVKLSAPIKKSEDVPSSLVLTAEGVNQGSIVLLTLTMTGSAEKASLAYKIVSAEQKIICAAEATILLTHYTGDELVTFTAVTNIHPASEQAYRESVTSMLNAALKVLDAHITENLDMTTHELGFIVLSEKYMAPVEATEAEEDLGGAFSSARLSMAGLMIIQGMGMIFLVLAVLWIVLLLFKKVFYKESTKPEIKSVPQPAEAPTPVAAPVSVMPATDDGALIAAITAAVSAYIDSDPALKSQFAGGFRVVSFKPTTKTRHR